MSPPEAEMALTLIRGAWVSRFYYTGYSALSHLVKRAKVVICALVVRGTIVISLRGRPDSYRIGLPPGAFIGI